MKWVGGEVVREVVKTRPGRDERIGAPGMQYIEGKFSMGKEAVPKVIREVGVSGSEGSDEVVFRRPHWLLCRVGSVHLWGTNCTGNRCERKNSLHSNEVSLSQMRLGRGREWAVKKAKMEVKDRT